MVLDLLDPNRDTWISQASFYQRNRRVVNLKAVGLSFLDIDCYKLDWSQNMTAEQMASTFVDFCRAEGVPEPSLIVYSGRGLQPKWIFDAPIPRPALPRWNALQKALLKKFEPYGADPLARDASRVLRLVETVNTKSGRYCHVVWAKNGADGKPYRYNFDSLCDLILPFTRAELQAMREARLTGEKQEKQKHPWAAGMTRSSLNWLRLEDLRTLMTLRGGIQEGERMNMLFLQMNFMALSKQVGLNTFYIEAAQLARQIDPRWTCRVQDLSTVYARFSRALKGETVVFNGQLRTPLYTPKTETLINQLCITDDEMRQLRTIISPAIKQERQNQTRMVKSREAGVISREDYEGRSSARQERARELHSKGMSIRKIAKEMGLSVGAISGYIKDVQGRV